ncbi:MULTISPECIES: VpaChn25_0724 family phage protein [Labrys]|uniref:Restriction system protein Mrr-like N-terminal domain-containing protein n=1 Tax=Labrys neptuniae TaxID=376174 RepID=A0ABV3PGI4_9HYPH|nr:hypothetical protein [Labrys sp. WJW]OCC01731.1 hypothetical protein BA190_27610 [Labrys sp. WJW]
MSFEKKLQEEARLIILRSLAEQIDGHLNSSLLHDELKTYGIPRRPREWVHDQLSFLAAMGAVIVREAGSVQIATLTKKGQRHVDREEIIAGVKAPSRVEP